MNKPLDNDKETIASFLDKTDWRKTIHRKLEACVSAEGTEEYPLCVKSLVTSTSADYPGWDSRISIDQYIKERELYYNLKLTVWLKNNPTQRRWQKYQYEKKLYLALCQDVFTYIKNLLAKKRMLLWGTEDIQHGKETGYIE